MAESILGKALVLKNTGANYATLVKSSGSQFNIGTRDFTVSIWYMARGAGTLFSLVTGATFDTQSVSIVHAGNGDVTLNLGVNNWTIGQQTSLSNGQWHQLTVVRSTDDSDRSLSFYIDGILQSTVTDTNINFNIQNITALIIGGESAVSSTGMDCDIADLRFWSSAVSAQDINDRLYLRLNATEIAESTLHAYWDFTNYTADSHFIDDLSSFQSKGTLIGGTVSNMPVHAPNTGYALFADRASGSVTIPSNDAYNFGVNEFTVESWFRTSSGGALLSRINMDANKNKSGWRLWVDNNGCITLDTFIVGNNKSFTTRETKITSDNRWHHIAAVRQGASGQIIIYLDGVEQDLQSGNPSYSNVDVSLATATPLMLGAKLQSDMGDAVGPLIPADIRGLNLRMCEVRIWNSARTAEDIYKTMLRTLNASEHSDLAGYWTFSTRTVVDQSQTLNIGTQTYEADIVEAQLPIRPEEFALSLPSSGSYVTCSDTTPYTLGTGDITLSSWIKVGASFDGGTIFSQSISGQTDAGVKLDLSSVGVLTFSLSVGSSPSSYTFTAITTLTDQNWHHISVVLNSTGVLLYVNGILMQPPLSLGTAVDVPAVDEIYLGANISGANTFVGELSEVCIWSAALSQREIQAYRWHSLSVGEMKGLVGYWSFDQRAPIDLSVNDNDGTEHGSADVVACPDLGLNPPLTSLYLNGTNAHASVDDSDALPAAFSIQMWFKVESVGTKQSLFSNACFNVSTEEVDSALYLGLNSDNNIVFGADPSAPIITSYMTVKRHQWYEVTITFDGTNASLYVNGNLEAPATAYTYSALPIIFNLYTLGAYPAQGSDARLFKGAIEAVRVWDTCLAQTQIRSQLYDTLTGGEEHLLAYLNFDDGDLTDMTGNGNNCTLTNAELRVSDFYNKPAHYALDLSQRTTGQYVGCGETTELNLTGSITLQASVRVSTLSNEWSVVAAKGSAYQLRINNTTGLANFMTSGCTAGISGTTDLNDGKWHHIAGVYDSSTGDVNIYIDGQLDNPSGGTSTAVTYGVSDHFAIGAQHSALTTTNLHGFVKEVRVWGKVVSPESIELHSNNKLIGNEPNLEGYWPMDYTDDTTTNDYSKNQNNGTLNGELNINVADLSVLPPKQQIKAQSRIMQDWHDESSTDGVTVYRTVISVLRSDGTPVVGSRIKIWAVTAQDIYQSSAAHPSPTIDVGDLEIYVRSGKYKVDENISAAFSTDAMGNVVVTTIAKELSTFSLKIWADFMDEEDRIIINPDENLHSNIKSTTGTTLLADRANSDQPPLLPAAQFDTATANTVAEAISNSVKTINLPPPTLTQSKYMYTGEAVLGAAEGSFLNPAVQSQQWDVGPDGDVYTREIKPDATAKNWKVTFGSSGPTESSGSGMAQLSMQYFTPEQSTAELASLGLGAPIMLTFEDLDTLGWPSWSDVKSFAIHTFDKGKKFVQVVIDFGSQVVNYVLTQAKHIGQAIAGFLSGILIKYIPGVSTLVEAMEKVMNFFRAMFDWNDMVSTMKVIANFGGQVPTIATDFITQSQGAVDSGLTGLKTSIEGYFDSIISSLGSQTPSGVAATNGGNLFFMDADGSAPSVTGTMNTHGVESNWLMHTLFSNSDPNDSSGSKSVSMTEEIAKEFKSLSNNIMNSLKDDAAIKAFQKMLTFFKEIMSNPHNFIQLAVQGVLSAVEAIAIVAVDMLKAIVDSIFSLLKLVLITIKSAMDAHLNIPLVTWLFEQKIMDGDGTKLTAINLSSLIIAIPTTIIYKVVTGTTNPPFHSFPSYDTHQIQIELPWKPVSPKDSKNIDSVSTDIDVSLVSEAQRQYDFNITYTVFWAVFSLLDFSGDQLTHDYEADGKPIGLPDGSDKFIVIIALVGNFFGIPEAVWSNNYTKQSEKDDAALWGCKFIAPGLDAYILLNSETTSKVSRRSKNPMVSAGGFIDRILKALFIFILGLVLLALSLAVAIEEGKEGANAGGIVLKFFQNLGEAVPVIFKFIGIIPGKETGIAIGAIDGVGDGVALLFSSIRTGLSRP